MPDLSRQSDWIELPLWCGSEESWRRRGLFVRQSAGQLELTNQAGQEWRLTLVSGDRYALAEQVAEWLQDILRSGWRVRTRALMTTMFLRLWLGDLFVHGIGGAKYDEITDCIISSYFRLPPPRFQVATGTLWLPIRDGATLPERSAHDCRQQLRSWRENPERAGLSTADPQVATLLAEKEQLIQAFESRPRSGLSRKQRRERSPIYAAQHARFQQIRQQLQQLAEEKLTDSQRLLDETVLREDYWQVMAHREYPFCCYPVKSLQAFAEQITS